MFEVEILSSSSNVAVGKIASQSTNLTDVKRLAEDAVDGDNSTFSHTKSENESWWQVDIEQTEIIQTVQIVNRFCGDPTTDNDNQKCLCRLSHANLEIYDGSGSTTPLASRALGDTCGKLTVVEAFESCSSTTASPSASPTLSPSASPSAVSSFLHYH